ncbi:MAG TPA: LPXTG cell wall anchor domain-containing protein [Natronosporangium sp.]
MTWTVNTYAPVPQYRLLEVVVGPAGSTVSNIAVTEGDGFPHQTGAPLVGEQRLPGDATSASLGVRAKWNNGYEEKQLRSGEVTFQGPCEKPVGEPTFTDGSSCEELTVTVTNPEDGAATTFTVTTSAGDTEEFTLEPGTEQTVSFPAAEGLTYEVSVDGTAVHSGAWENPGDCVVEIPISAKSDCDSLTIEVTNPLEDEALEVTITSGDATSTLTIAPGETGEATFDAEEGTTATVTIGDESEEIAWTEPEGCGGSGGDLPVTGSNTGIMIGAAVALLALGGGLFLVARRRRVTFSA